MRMSVGEGRSGFSFLLLKVFLRNTQEMDAINHVHPKKEKK